jgi:hypothetical protein
MLKLAVDLETITNKGDIIDGLDGYLASRILFVKLKGAQQAISQLVEIASRWAGG